MKRVIIIQCALCLFLLCACTVIGRRTQYRTVEAGAFGNGTEFNDTLEDIAFRLYREHFDE